MGTTRNVKNTLQRAHAKLDRDLADLRGCIGFETWRLVKRGEVGGEAEGAQAPVPLPAEVALALGKMQELAEAAYAPDKKARWARWVCRARWAR